MKNLPLKIHVVGVTVALLCLLLGCDQSGRQPTAVKKEKPIPKQRFHLPKTYPKGVARIRELFDAANGEGNLPEPISYQVLEILHGTGAAAHSHFHLLKDSKEQNFDDDGHVKMGEKTHEITVEWSSELSDLAKWLPKIAVGGDMNEQNWLKVRDLSATLSSELETAFKDANDELSKRESLKQRGESIAKIIEQLETLLPNAANTEAAE